MGKQQIDAYTTHDYHQPSDELTDDWVFDGMVADTRFGLLATYLIAQADDMQSWNPGDEFAAARAQALAILQPPNLPRLAPELSPSPAGARHSVSVSARRRASTKSRSERRFRYFSDSGFSPPSSSSSAHNERSAAGRRPVRSGRRRPRDHRRAI